MKKIDLFTLPDGKRPFEEWQKKQTNEAKVHIDRYIKRVANGGSKSNLRNLGDGVIEIKIDKGPGYRVYFCEIGDIMILLLLGGHKSSQKRDIKKAKEYRRSIDV